ncbi:BTAD domain-containing putative transcriptional regulator [Actinoplanes sp. L3-i22]|uniref:BTAD domain-containing putative transcriptional regulator n=1 Tax=Actinoplanes sp. L3-i22 TaxID=2836373 RepID=UPI001C77500E|nr:BTAD domain-containing putative transcriptional regulator [Actinoplanes sp. L3-i22]BCY07218.1 hypothetical protein L3i22_023060 [Actinoplanes sp. L3-i22]
MAVGTVRLQILGPLRAWRGDVELATGPRQQAYLLALLLARPGRPISTSELVDLIWEGDAPASALNVIHKYVGSLRHVLEPGLAPREAGSHLLRRGSGYLFEAGPGTVDLEIFRRLVARADADLAGDRPEPALDHYVAALEMWRGPAGDGLTGGADATAIFAGLDDEFFEACGKAAGLAVSAGRPERVLAPLSLAASMAPLHEPVQTGLVTALGAAGRTADALALFAAVRTRLADELGISPGAALQQAYLRVLDQSVMPPAVAAAPEPEPAGLVGRAGELAQLDRAMAAATAGGSSLVLVRGEPGVGKTALLEAAAERAGKAGALVAWGRCLEGDGIPTMWPWAQVVDTIHGRRPAGARADWPIGPSIDTGTRFRLFEQVAALVAGASAERPIMIVVDDLHWADVASLDLFGHLAAELPSGTVLVGALRDHAPEPAPGLLRVLAAAARRPGHRRIRLGPLGPADVAELVRRESGREIAAGVGDRVHARTDGNPFFVLELSRLLAGGSGVLTPDDAGRVGVPSTVRDIVRGRTAGLDECTRYLLRAAALIGREGDIGLLARVTGVGPRVCLERLEVLESLALIGQVPADPHLFRFRHDLVRESVTAATPLWQLTRLHLCIADALDDVGPAGAAVTERVAHHLWSAGPLVEPERTVTALRRAGRHPARELQDSLSR